MKMAVTANKLAFEMRRVTALIGPFGSGKSELAVGLAMHAARVLAAGREAAAAGAFGNTRAVLGDLDVLKPYFRSREVKNELSRVGIETLAPTGALANSDLPIITPELRGAILRHDLHVVLDVGGDPVGARALGSLSDVMNKADYDLLLVLNRYRPFMDSVDGVIEHARQIVGATHLNVSGVISNTHMLEDTTMDDVYYGLELSHAVAAALSVKVRLVGVPESLAAEAAEAKLADTTEGTGTLPVVAIRRQLLPSFLGGVVLAQSKSPLQTPQGL